MGQQLYFECTVDENRKITIPSEICEKLGICAGDRVRFLSVNKDFLFQPSIKNDTL